MTAALKLAAALTAALLLPALPAAAQSAKPLPLPELKYERYTLPNGLTVLTHEDHRLPLVAVDLWYHVGPLNERPGRTGFAHLFEHMMFEGSEHVGEKAHFKFVEGAGATDINGTTDFDRTNYFETLPANQLELGMWLESDRMGYLLEGLDRVKLANQRDVVRNERRQGEGSPYDLADEEVFHLLFPAQHPYYASVIGSHADIEAARIADVRDFHQQFYTPNNASIAIAGDFNPAQLKALLTKYFGPIPAGPKVEPVTIVTAPITIQKRSTVTDTVTLPRLTVGFLLPAAFTPADPGAQILSAILGGDKASRLDKTLRYQRQVAQSVDCSDRSLKLTSIFTCNITAKPGVKLEDLETAFWQEVAKLQKDGPTQAELDAARTSDLTQKITGLQRLGGFGGVADTLNSYNQYTGDPGYLAKDVARYQALTTADIRDVAAKYLNKNEAVVVSCTPGDKVVHEVPRSPDTTDAEVKVTPPYTAEVEAQQSWRKTPPAAGPAVVPNLPIPTEFTLKNGLKVLLVQNHSLPLLSAALVTRAGDESNPIDKPGLAGFTASMLPEGTDTLTAVQVAEAAKSLGTSINVNGGTDSTIAQIDFLTNHTDGAFTLLADVLRHPAFRAEDLERIRKQRILRIQQESDDVSGMAGRVGAKLLFGEHPYGFPSIGTEPVLKAATRDDLHTFYSAHYGPADSALILVGDVNEAEAHRLADHYFGDWSGTASGKPTLPPPPAPPTLKIVIVDKPGSPQTALQAVGLGVDRFRPDERALHVLNYTLGGSFSSRINMNLREVHGYTYGAFAFFDENRGGGSFISGGLVRTDITAPATKELMMELRKILTDPPTALENTHAKDSSIQSLPGQFETNGSAIYSVSSMFLYDRPLNYYAIMPAALRAVTTDATAAAAQTYIHPENLYILEVGDKAKIEPALKELNLAPIVHADPLGNLIP